jgi:hypothetical protein
MTSNSDDETAILAQCAAMVELLRRDMDEADRASEVAVEDRHLNQQQGLYLDVWRRLDSRTRSAWKTYVRIANGRPIDKDQRRAYAGR